MKESHKAWYLKSHDQLASLSTSKDGYISVFLYILLETFFQLWHKQAIKKSYKKCRFTMGIASVLAHAHNYLSTTVLLLALRT